MSILHLADRLDKTAGRCGQERFRHYSVAVANLERAAIVVPFGDIDKMQPPDPKDGSTQAQTYKGRQTQTQAACVIGQSLQVLRLIGMLGSRVFLRQNWKRF